MECAKSENFRCKFTSFTLHRRVQLVSPTVCSNNCTDMRRCLRIPNTCLDIFRDSLQDGSEVNLAVGVQIKNPYISRFASGPSEVSEKVEGYIFVINLFSGQRVLKYVRGEMGAARISLVFSQGQQSYCAKTDIEPTQNRLGIRYADLPFIQAFSFTGHLFLRRRLRNDSEPARNRPETLKQSVHKTTRLPSVESVADTSVEPQLNTAPAGDKSDQDQEGHATPTVKSISSNTRVKIAQVGRA
ncbi:hypothetical protein RRG08_014805 [Elysia crispata]|uniref:Uncharacterized protein n=1 Tax=Elysia crispata TaxID=231223 RepID=A0AAE0Z3A3_9GAST|nr:hypothetical protein RRG08_014805 [Elysia crispata]